MRVRQAPAQQYSPQGYHAAAVFVNRTEYLNHVLVAVLAHHGGQVPGAFTAPTHSPQEYSIKLTYVI